MARCEVCGNEYEKSFEIIMEGKTHIFDSFECAIHGCAPICAHCGCTIIGHGFEMEEKNYCCAQCVRRANENMKPNVKIKRFKKIT